MKTANKKSARLLTAVLAAVMAISLCACDATGLTSKQIAAAAAGGGNIPLEPQLYENTFDGAVEVGNGIFVDLTTAESGYIGVLNESGTKVKIQISMGDSKYTYNAFDDGRVTYVPLNCGDGTYTWIVLSNSVDTRYAVTDMGELSVIMNSEFEPYLHANVFADFDRDSKVTQKAYEMAAECETELDFMVAVYQYICDNVSYDNELASTVQDGYVPDPDRTLETGTGICFDYASLAVAMLRSVGLPAKLITGYVGEAGLYHAWNSVYIEDTGWISVEMKIDSVDWTRIDLTFAAAGNTEETRYVDRYVY